MKPALTAEEWARGCVVGAVVSGDALLTSSYWGGESPEWVANPPEWTVEDGVLGGKCDRHKLAALALYGQLFGFTWEDVHNLRDTVEMLRYQRRSWADAVSDLADRIEALLPPETIASNETKA